MINWKLRFKNPMFVVQLVLSIVIPIVGYFGMEVKDLTSWSIVGDLFLQAISNPYVLSLIVVSVYNAVLDPTTKGVKDSDRALNRVKPK